MRYRLPQELGSEHRERGEKDLRGGVFENVAQPDFKMTVSEEDRVGKAGVGLEAYPS